VGARQDKDASGRLILDWLHDWQTLAAATTASIVASIATYIAFQNTTRSLRHAESLEKHRRSRKHAALRAVLPLAVSQVTNYAEQSAHTLNSLISRCSGETLPERSTSNSVVRPLPSETLKSLADFIEYSDAVDVEIIESTVAFIQIHDSRLHDLVRNNQDPSNVRIVVRTELEGLIIDAASIYAGAAAVFEYARRRQAQIPRTISWDRVEAALRNMQMWDDQHPRLHEALARRARLSAGPFAAISQQPSEKSTA